MLVDTDLSPAQMKRLAGNIYRASRKIQELLQDLLNVSRGRTGGAEMCRLSDIIAAGCEPFQSAVESRSIDLSIDVANDLELPLERARIERVVQNLVGNALEVLPDGGRISISARADSGWAYVTVTDTGPGILPEIRHRLQTVIDHGGDIWAESAAGEGAKFVFRLPLARAVAQVPDLRVIH
jgi:two-component system OmpR family sensor kinase